MKTTLNKIREHEPCKSGWENLLKYLGKTKSDDEPLSIATIIDSNGIDDAIWCLQAVEGYDKEIRLYAVWCARQVQHLLKDQRSLDALDVAERFANGEATDDELTAAASAARAAASADGDTAGAARYAAEAAAYAAAWTAAWYAADAAADVADDAARYAANATAYAVWAAGSARSAAEGAREKQEAELRRICEEEER